MAEFAASDAGGAARQGRSGQFLDLHLHQLAAPASLCPRLGREIQGPGTGGDRRPCAGVRIRKEHRQRPLGREGHEDRLPGRGRQQPCHLARFQEPGLAGTLFHRCARTCPPSLFWRRLLRTVGNGHPGAAARGRRHRRQSRAGHGGCPRSRRRRRLDQSQISGKLCRVRAHREFCVAGRTYCGTSLACINGLRG